jgi:DNA-binding transcriptional MerR regulator
MIELKMGSKTFLRRVGIYAPKMRILEAAGIVNPSKSDSGWRQFSESDVTAALKYLAAEKRRA